MSEKLKCGLIGKTLGHSYSPQIHGELADYSYKLCEVCGAIVDKASPTCPDCLAYRFDADSVHVADRALDLAAKPQNAVSHHDTLE